MAGVVLGFFSHFSNKRKQEKGSQEKKSSECPPERSRAELSAQPAVAMKRNVAVAEHSQNPRCWRIPKRQNCTSLLPKFESKSQAAGGPAQLRKSSPVVLRLLEPSPPSPAQTSISISLPRLGLKTLKKPTPAAPSCKKQN